MVNVIKIGGNVVDNPEALKQFVSDFASLTGPKILVHGGGKEATRLGKRLDIPATMIDGRRVTSAETLDVVTMVYAGLINKRIVSMLQAAGCDALGLTGADGDAIRATRRKPAPVDYGFVGDIDPKDVNSRLLNDMLDNGMVPVMCAITHDGAGTLLNCNADTIASSVAMAMARVRPTRLTYCFEQPGVMRDIADPTSVIPEITPDLYNDLRADGTIVAGMIPKIDNAFAAVRAGVDSVTIKQASALTVDSGTTIRL